VMHRKSNGFYNEAFVHLLRNGQKTLSASIIIRQIFYRFV
jgi:hypothetical protein